MRWMDFVANVQQWAAERGIYEHSTALAQVAKMHTESAELVDAIYGGGDKRLIADAVGDMCVCAVNVSYMSIGDAPNTPIELPWELSKEEIWMTISEEILYSARRYQKDEPLGVHHGASVAVSYAKALAKQHYGIPFEHCLQVAWDAIKDRKGKVVPGGAFVKEGD